MAYRYTDVNTRTVYNTVSGRVGGTGKTVRFWEDQAGTQPVNVGAYTDNTPDTPGPSTGSNQLVVQADGMWPPMWDLGGLADHMWVQVGTSANPGQLFRIYCDADQRLDALAAVVADAETAEGAQSKADAAQAAATAAASALVGDLSGVSNQAAARTNLGLGDSATRNVGTTAGTVAAGDAPTAAQAAAVAAAQTYTNTRVANPPEPVLLGHKTLPSGVQAGAEPGAMVVWTFDDGYGTAADYFNLLSAKNVKGTLFLTKNWVNRAGIDSTWNDTYITQAQVQTIIAQGHEIGTHGVNHENHLLYQQNNGSAALHTLVREGVDYIEQTYGITVLTGAYPFGLSDPVVREVIGRSHVFYRGTKGKVAARGQDPFDVHSIDVQTLTEAQIKAFVDQAVTDRALCIFLVHGGLTSDNLNTFSAVIDYCTSLGIRQGTFYQAMMERTKLRGAAAASLDSSGHAYLASLRTPRVEIVRTDALADRYWLDLDEATNRPQFDASSASTWEFVQPARMLNSFFAGERDTFIDGVTTSGSTTVTSGSAGFYARDVGRTITGAGIPGGTTIQAVTNSTTATLSQAATATATGVTITIGRPTGGIATFARQADFLSTTNIRSAGTPALNFANLAGTAVGSISHTAWSRVANGGPMLIDSGTGGSYITIKGHAVRLLKHDDSSTVTLMYRNGTPQSANAEPVGSLTLQANGTPAAGVLWVKEDGAATNTGWAAVQTRTGVYVKEGTNGRQGVATLVGGTVTVANTSVTANSRIFLTTQAPGGTVGTPYVSARVVGTSFSITSTSASDTSVVAFQICEPG